ncbi:hypothetical protein HDZ31DRAFT_43185 [Schizophyllum fasciatum]
MSRPLRLHLSALSDAEFEYFTATLALLTDYRRPEHSARDDRDFAEGAELPASGLCAWLLGKLCPAFPSDKVATIMSSVAPSGGMVDGTQFFAVARLALHCLNGETIGDGDDCRKLAFVQVQNIPLRASKDGDRATSKQSPPPKLRVHFWPADDEKPCQFEFAFPESGFFHPESQSRTFLTVYGPDVSLGVYSYFDSTANCWTTTPEPLRVPHDHCTVHIRALPRRDAATNSRKRPRTSDVAAEAAAPPAGPRSVPLIKLPKYPATPAPSPGYTAPSTPAPPPAPCHASASAPLPTPTSSISSAASFSIPLSSPSSAPPPTPTQAPAPMPPGHPLPELGAWPRTPRSAFPFKYACHMAAFFEAVEGLKPVFPNKEEAYRYLMQGTAPWHASTYWKHHRLYAKRERDSRLRAAVEAGMCEAGEWNRYLRDEEAAGRVQETESLPPATPVA